MLYVVMWVESHVIIVLRYDTRMVYVFCDNPRYVVLGLFSCDSGRCSVCCYSILS